MLSKKMQDALNEQINHELYSAYLYLSMAAYFAGKSLMGFHNWMKVQSKEEVEHAVKIFDFIYDRGGKVTLRAITQPEIDFKSTSEVLQKTLEHEKKVSGLIHKLYELALQENDYPSQVMLQWFVEEQVEEEKSVSQIIEELKLVGDSGPGLFTLDRQLAERK